MPMQYVDIGGVGLSKMTLGTVQLGMDYGIANKNGRPGYPEAAALLDAALCGGVNSLDTAMLYGESERILGKYLAERPPKDLFVTTKFKVDRAHGVSPDEIGAQIEGYLRQSLERMGIPMVSLYMMHAASDMTQYGGHAVKTMMRLKEAGLVERIGVSVYRASEIDEMLKIGVFDAVQLPMSVFDQRLAYDGTVDRLRAKGMLIFVRSVFLQGLLFLDPMPDGLEKAAHPARRLREIASGYGLSVGEMALKFIRDMEGVTSLVIGAETAGQVHENLAFFSSGPLDSTCRQDLIRLGGEIPIDDILMALLGR